MASENPRAPGYPCTIATTLDSMEAQDAEALGKALADSTVQAATLARALVKIGFAVRSDTIGRHRRGECRCSK